MDSKEWTRIRIAVLRGEPRDRWDVIKLQIESQLMVIELRRSSKNLEQYRIKRYGTTIPLTMEMLIDDKN